MIQDTPSPSAGDDDANGCVIRWRVTFRIWAAEEASMAQQTSLPPIVAGRWYPMTFEEFLTWSPDEGQAEWVDGRGIIYVSNIIRHGRILEFLARLLGTYLELKGLGELFTQGTLLHLAARPSGRMPDLLVMLAEHGDRIGERWIEGPADFVVELLSDDSVGRDRRDKMREYEAARVPEYLIVEARLERQGLELYRLDAMGRYRSVAPDEAGRYHSQVVPGFWLDPAWLWQAPLPKVATVMELIVASGGPTP